MRFKRCLKINLLETVVRLGMPLALVLSSHGLQFPAPPGQQRLSVETPSQVTVKPGAEVVQTLNVTVEPGFHVNSDKPRGEFLVPLKLSWSGEALQPEYITYPKSEVIKVAGEEAVVFTGNFQIVTHFKAAQSAPRGPALMTGKLHYQACNNQMCFRPATAEVRLPVIIQ